jgi:hypothetical protein
MFRFPRDSKEAAGEKDRATSSVHATGHFWLCEKCSTIYTLQFEPGRGVVIRLLWPELPAAKEEMRLPAS